MKLKLPQRLLWALLATFTASSIYAEDVALTQSSANAHKIYSQEIYETYNFIIGESITFKGYSITAPITIIKTDGFGKKSAYEERGHIFRFDNSGKTHNHTFKGDDRKSYSVSFSNNTVAFLTPPSPLPAGVEDKRSLNAQGGAIHYTTLILHNVRDMNARTEENSIIFEGNKVLVDYDPAEDMQQVTGGAIYTYYLNINNSGNVLFKNNYTTGFGGAVTFRYSTFQQGEVVKNELFAKYGDITFVANPHRLASRNERNSGIASSIYFISFFLTSGETVINPEVCFAADSGLSYSV